MKCRRGGCQSERVASSTLCAEHLAGRLRRQQASAKMERCECGNTKSQGAEVCGSCAEERIERDERAVEEQRQSDINEMLDWFKREKANGRIE